MARANAQPHWMKSCERARAALLAVALVFTSACSRPKEARYEPPDERFVFFSVGKAEVPYDGFFAVGYVTALLDARPSYRVLVVGHADPTGARTANRELSWKRARHVARLLVDHGVDAKRVRVALPEEEKDDASMAEVSRRVDIFVYDPGHEKIEKRIGYRIEIEKP